MNNKKFVHLDTEGKPWGTVSVNHLWAQVYSILYSKPELRLDSEIWRSLFQQAQNAAIQEKAEAIWVRIRKEYDPEVFREILQNLGYAKASERVEYRADVAALPSFSGGPLRWQTAQELGWQSDQIAEFASEVTKNALDIDPNEKAEDFIQDWLKNDELTHGLNCISIGFSGEVACALCVVQIEKETGWSRISYMGLIPSFRGQGLGKWVHRRGFDEMKKHGGKSYHCGTNSENHAMKKLFEMHNCQKVIEMEEWGWKKV